MRQIAMQAPHGMGLLVCLVALREHRKTAAIAGQVQALQSKVARAGA